MSRLVRLAAVIAPVLGLAALWAMSDRAYSQGTDWEVPIAGYDPRDYLRGHYVEFTYDWPGLGPELGPEPGDLRGNNPAMLCLEGKAPVLARVKVPNGGACDHPVRADTSGVYGGDALVRGRLYLGQDRAEALQQQLQDQGQRGIVTIRQREDGSFTAIAIRFRPLTAAEVAERDARVAPDGAVRIPPAIRVK